MEMYNSKMRKIKMLKQGILLSALMILAAQASAVTVKLCTGQFIKTMPDGALITMWGFGLEAVTPSPTCASATVPGPEIIVPVGDTALTINVRNTLANSVSVMIPGLTAVKSLTSPAAPVFNPTTNRVRSFTHETATATTGVYNFTVRPGTYLYQTGTHIAKQVQMGLYGATIQENSAFVPLVPATTPPAPAAALKPAVPATAYPGVSFDRSVTMLYSEIDPLLHAAVANNTYGTAAYSSTINYSAKYYLVNGEAYTTGTAPTIPVTKKIYGGIPGSTILFRFLNAGLQTHVPVINGHHVDLIAEYGNQYPYSRKQYSVMLPAGQTRDAIMTAPTVAGDFAIYDRRLRLTNSNQAGIGGMYSVINIATVNLNAVKAVVSDGASNISTGGGGCSFQSTARFDPLLPLLFVLSLVFIIRRQRQK